MVVFTCNHCGDSLQKPKVEKHYFTVCRTAKFLTCVDCFKDFRNEEYVAHTKCITEEERYAAKGSLPSQGVVKKGEVKQQSWTDLVQSIVENTTNATGGQRKVFEIMSNSSNVPRKRNKFINFIRSSTGNKVNIRDVESVWDLIEQRKKGQEQASGNSNETEKQVETEKEAEPEASEFKQQAETANQDLPKKKKKKSTSVEKIEAAAAKETSETSVNEVDSVQDLPKKKKKKSKLHENGVGAAENNKRKSDQREENTDKILENADSKKNKKSKHLNKEEQANISTGVAINESEVAINDTLETSNVVEVNIMQDLPKKKKKKSKSHENGVEPVAEVLENGKSEQIKEGRENNILENGSSKKNKSKHLNNDAQSNVSTEVETLKKKRKSETKDADIIENGGTPKKKAKNNENEESTLEENTVTNGEVTNDTLNDSEASKKFSFEEKVLEVLKAKNNITLKKLEKKVLGAYSKHTGVELSEKVVKKFNKKLKKMNSIEILENGVKLLGN